MNQFASTWNRRLKRPWLEVVQEDYISIPLLAVVYFLAAKFGLSLAIGTEQVSTIFPATGIALAALLIFGYRLWPGIALGAFAANLALSEPALTAGIIAATNTLSGVLGAYLLREKFDFKLDLQRVWDVFGLVVFGGIVSTLLSSTFGTMNLFFSGIIREPEFVSVWVKWWVGDLMGVLVVTPLLLGFTIPKIVEKIKKKWFERLVFFGLLLTVSVAIFFSRDIIRIAPAAYLVFPFIIWSALRFTQTGISLTNFVIASFAVWGTILHRGPFAFDPEVESNLIYLLTYIFVLATTALFLGAAMGERKKMQEKVQYQMQHDLLTDLGNRFYFVEHMNFSVEQAGALGVSMAVFKIDVDRFKNVVDSLGYQAGDRLLKEIGLRLRMLVGENETLARLGSDEFGIILPKYTDKEEVIIYAKKILKSFSSPFSFDSHSVHITVSVGVSIYPADGTDTSALLRNSHASLRRAKELGGNRYMMYVNTFNSGAFKQLTLENDLRLALENSEFETFFQPQVDLRSGRMTKAEALLRWRKPGFGLKPAKDFIDLAETTGVFEQLELFSLKKSIEQAALWYKGNMPLCVAVNISASLFREENFYELISNLLSEHGLPGKYLELELTERTFLENSDAVVETLKRLRKLGIEISIDDFNTGYSNIHYIKNYPVSIIKIGGTFIRGIPRNAKDCAIAESILTLAQGLNIEVVAEEVENKDQIKFLHERGCDRLQGYYFSQVIEASGITQLLKNKKTWEIKSHARLVKA